MHGSTPASSPRGTPSRRGRSPRTTTTTRAIAGHTSNSSAESDKPPTVTSSLSIAVQGALPIDKSDDFAKAVHEGTPAVPPTTESKRAPRKSKTDALAALNTRSHSPTFGFEELVSMESLSRLPPIPLNGDPIPISPELDLSSVKTSSPRSVPPRTKPRPFGLKDCPVFYPSSDEFKDPMAYVRSISGQAQMYGICKIVPPTGWEMPFMTDTEAFRFKTRLQRLNSIEASSRAKLNFLEALYRFHKQQGNPRVTVPTINHKPLDLWLLRKEVHKLGGYDAVNKGKKWADLGRLLGYGGIPGLSTQIKNSYVRVIMPFEQLAKYHHPKSPISFTAMSRDVKLNTTVHPQTPIPGRTGGRSSSVDSASGPNSPLSNTSSPLSEPPDDIDMNGANTSQVELPRMRRSFRNGSGDTPLISNGGLGLSLSQSGTSATGPSVTSHPAAFKDDTKVVPKQEQTCEVCHKTNRETEMLLCDGCDCGFHTFCLVPPLSTVPKGQWFCHTCLFGTGGDFGFDEGEEHSLSSFQARDLAFRRMWFESHPPPPSFYANDDPTVTKLGSTLVSEYDVENEFWRLVESTDETVEIEYGADIHSTTHGSAMPTLESHPLDPYAKDGWNLNNIPIISDSLLRYIKSDISGMTVPWTYVGMIFSTFCWHNEDHYTYSINFMHWGETKTWYGIPGDDAEKFEAAIRREAPDLFESQPDLLFQLVTLMNPKRLTDAGVRVYACNQRAGEFVVTFPKAYHAGFNHGLNFNEAVNFALPDWLPYGRDCVQRYQEHRKLPVFSHDELLITITQQSHSIKTAIWLNDSLQEMTSREMSGRRNIRTSRVREVLEERDHPEDQYQCFICKVFCYLSQVICPCPKAHGARIACLDHAVQLCDCPMSQRTLRLRFSDDELLNIQATISSRAAVPVNWRTKLKKVLDESSQPSLRSLRALLAEGDRINYPLEELPALRKCVTRANEWVDAANSFTTRKQSRKRSKRFKGGQPLLADGPAALDDVLDKPDRGLADLYALLQEVDNLGFDAPEIGLLKTLAVQAEESKVKAKALLDTMQEGDRSSFLQECETLLAHGSSLNVHLEELEKVENIVLQEQLIKELKEVDDSSVTLEEVRQLLSRARACNLPTDNKYMKILDSRLQAGNDWDQRAVNLLTQPVKTTEELDQFIEFESNIPVDPTVLSRLTSARTKALEFERQAKAWLAAEANAVLPKVPDALRLVQRAEKEFDIPAIHDLKRTAEFAYDLEERCEAVIQNRYQHQEDGPIFDTIYKWRSYAREHLAKFALPNFNKLNQQLELHDQWIQKLPWYCTDHEEPHTKEVLDDVVQNTKPEDDAPPNDEFFTCICFEPVRPPPPGQVSDAVQCDHCFARFHGICAVNGGSCPFCDPNHWNGTIHKDRSWHFCYLPTVLLSAPEITKNYSEAWAQLDIIVRRVDRLSAVIGQFLSFASQVGNQRPEYIPQVRHYMRKLYKIQFAVSPNPEVSFGLDLAGLHRILAGRPPPIRMKKRRRPKFVFGQDVDKDWIDGTRCICRGRTPYLRGYPSVECESCSRLYHIACVFYSGPLPTTPGNKPQFTCPLCSLRKAKLYRYADVRVKYIDGSYEDPNIFVDVRACLENFSKDIIKIKLSPPITQTLFVDLVQFTPGQPDNVAVNPPPSVPANRPSNGFNHSHSSHRVIAPISPPHHHVVTARQVIPNGPTLPPPPPWTHSTTLNAASSSAVPMNADMHLSQNRKRKHTGDDRPLTPDSMGVYEANSSPKRKLPSQPSIPPSSPHRSENLSPSLSAMMAHPVPVTPHRTPTYQPRPYHSPSHRPQSHRSPHWSPPSPPIVDASHKRLGPSTAVDVTPPVVTHTTVRKVKLLVRESQQRERDGLQEPANTPVPTAL